MQDEVEPAAFIADRAYDADPLIERFFARLRQLKAIAMRYGKLKSTCFVAVQPVSTVTGMN